MDLALVAGLNVPFDVGFEGWPPEAVEEGAVAGFARATPPQEGIVRETPKSTQPSPKAEL